MTSELLLHPDTKARIASFTGSPAHALLLIGPPGAGKRSVALDIASVLLRTTLEKLNQHPYFTLLAAAAGKTISVDDVRGITHFLMLRATSNNDVSRVVVVEQAQRMTVQAQNALLKTIEEPPAGTVLILTAPGELGLLPTIQSRVQTLQLRQPGPTAAAEYFANEYQTADVQKALVVSGGLPGLTKALLDGDTSHPLATATTTAREILRGTTFDRIAMTDSLAKDKQRCLDTLFILARMAEISLGKEGSNEAVNKRWQHILRGCHDAEAQILASAQIKLVLLNFMLSI